MNNLYLLNSPVLTDYGIWRYSGPIEPTQARNIAADGFASAIGHEASARLFATILAADVPVARIRVRLGPGDRALVLRLLERLPEGAVLNYADLQTSAYELSLLERLE